MPNRIHVQRLPADRDSVVALFNQVLRLSGVMKIEVTPDEFSVVRDMEDGEAPVVPPLGSGDSVDAAFLLRSVDLEPSPVSPEVHPYLAYQELAAQIVGGGLRICGIVAPQGSLFPDFFGLDAPPATFMGVPVIYHVTESGDYDEKFVVLGGPTMYPSDATSGWIVEIGL